MTMHEQFSFLPPAPVLTQKTAIKKPPVPLQITEAEAISHFEDFWRNHVWLKADKRHAQTAYVKAVRERRGTPQEIADGADRYAAYLKRNPSRSVKYPQGWLSGDRWLDGGLDDDRGSAERARSSAHLGAARLFSGRAGLR